MEDRKTYIGGSDAAVILGFSKHKTNLALWLEKTGRTEDQEETLPMRFGKFAEPFVRELYEEKAGRKVEGVGEFKRSKEYPFIAAHFDGKGVELKTVSPYMAKTWGEPPNGNIPEDYFCQCQHYMFVDEAETWEVGALFGNSDFRIYRVIRSEEFIKRMVEKEIEFWESLKNERPPEETILYDARDLFKKIWPTSILPMRQATKEDEDLVEKFKEAERKKDEAEEQFNAIRNKLVLGIEDNEGIQGENWKITYKSQKGKETTDWKSIAMELGVVSDDLKSKYTKRGEPFRVFRTNFKED